MGGAGEAGRLQERGKEGEEREGGRREREDAAAATAAAAAESPRSRAPPRARPSRAPRPPRLACPRPSQAPPPSAPRWGRRCHRRSVGEGERRAPPPTAASRPPHRGQPGSQSPRAPPSQGQRQGGTDPSSFPSRACVAELSLLGLQSEQQRQAGLLKDDLGKSGTFFAVFSRPSYTLLFLFFAPWLKQVGWTCWWKKLTDLDCAHPATGAPGKPPKRTGDREQPLLGLKVGGLRVWNILDPALSLIGSTY